MSKEGNSSSVDDLLKEVFGEDFEKKEMSDYSLDELKKGREKLEERIKQLEETEEKKEEKTEEKKEEKVVGSSETTSSKKKTNGKRIAVGATVATLAFSSLGVATNILENNEKQQSGALETEVSSVGKNNFVSNGNDKDYSSYKKFDFNNFSEFLKTNDLGNSYGWSDGIFNEAYLIDSLKEVIATDSLLDIIDNGGEIYVPLKFYETGDKVNVVVEKDGQKIVEEVSIDESNENLFYREICSKNGRISQEALDQITGGKGLETFLKLDKDTFMSLVSATVNNDYANVKLNLGCDEITDKTQAYIGNRFENAIEAYTAKIKDIRENSENYLADGENSAFTQFDVTVGFGEQGVKKHIKNVVTKDKKPVEKDNDKKPVEKNKDKKPEKEDKKEEQKKEDKKEDEKVTPTPAPTPTPSPTPTPAPTPTPSPTPTPTPSPTPTPTPSPSPSSSIPDAKSKPEEKNDTIDNNGEDAIAVAEGKPEKKNDTIDNNGNTAKEQEQEKYVPGNENERPNGPIVEIISNGEEKTDPGIDVEVISNGDNESQNGPIVEIISNGEEKTDPGIDVEVISNGNYINDQGVLVETISGGNSEVNDQGVLVETISSGNSEVNDQGVLVETISSGNSEVNNQGVLVETISSGNSEVNNQGILVETISNGDYSSNEQGPIVEIIGASNSYSDVSNGIEVETISNGNYSNDTSFEVEVLNEGTVVSGDDVTAIIADDDTVYFVEGDSTYMVTDIGNGAEAEVIEISNGADESEKDALQAAMDKALEDALGK